MKSKSKKALVMLFFFTHACAAFAYDWSRVIGQNPKIKGPNCWNLVLVDLGYLPHLSFSSSDEFSQVLDLYCKPIYNMQKLKKGDVGRITTEYKSDLHAFVILDSQNGLTKDFGSDDPSTDISYRNQLITNIFFDYYKDPKSQECLNGLANKELSPCGSLMSFYRCDKNKISSDQNKLNHVFPKTMPLLVGLRQVLENYHFGRSTLEDLNMKITNLNEVLDLEMAKVAESNNEKNLLKNRLQGVSESLLGITAAKVLKY